MRLARQRFEHARQNRRAESVTTLSENRPADLLAGRFPAPVRDLAVSGRQAACSSAQFHSGRRKAAGSSAESTGNRRALSAYRPMIPDNAQAEYATGSVPT